MSRFYASIQGNRGEATRMGGKGSGITGHIRGWDVGIRVIGHVSYLLDEQDNDVFTVYLTFGSNGGGNDKIIGTFTAADLGKE